MARRSSAGLPDFCRDGGMLNALKNGMNPVDQFWRKGLVRGDATIEAVIKNLDETGLQIALVVSQDGVLLGTVTDGDVRRALLRGRDFQSSAERIMFTSPLVVPPDMGRDTVLNLMRANKIHQLPIVDESRHVMGLHLWDEIVTPTKNTNLMVIMAGGAGKRLLPLTEACPKPLLPIGGKPMLEHIVERAKAEGFENFLFAVHYLGNMIEEHFGDGRRWSVHIEYLREERPLGTAGALGLMQAIPDSPFLVTNGDVLTDIRYAELLDFHVRHQAVATMAVREHEWQNPFGVVRTKGVEIVGFEEKPVTRSHINAGIYVLDPNVLQSLDQNEYCDMPTLFTRVKEASGRTIVYPMHEPWLDVGRPADLALARSNHA